MTTRMAVTLVAILGLVGPTFGQPQGSPPLGGPLGGVVLPPHTGPGEILAPDGPPHCAGDIYDEPACCAEHSFWVAGDILVGWVGGMQLPPLVSTSPRGTPQVNAGVFGTAGF